MIAANVCPYPVKASGDDFRELIFLTHTSINLVSIRGIARAQHRMHQAAASQAAGAGWIKTDRTALTTLSDKRVSTEELRFKARLAIPSSAQTRTWRVLMTSMLLVLSPADSLVTIW